MTDAERGTSGEEFFGAAAAVENVHPIRGISAENCTEQLGVPGAWYERLPHFRVGYTPSSGAERQSEYFVRREDAVDALPAIKSMADAIRPHIYTSEIRAVARDELWLRPSCERDSVALHFTWKPHDVVIGKTLPLIERELSRFDARRIGETVHDRTREDPTDLPAVRRFPEPGRAVRPGKKIPERYSRPTVFGNRLNPVTRSSFRDLDGFAGHGE